MTKEQDGECRLTTVAVADEPIPSVFMLIVVPPTDKYIALDLLAFYMRDAEFGRIIGRALPLCKVSQLVLGPDHVDHVIDFRPGITTYLFPSS